MKRWLILLGVILFLWEGYSLLPTKEPIEVPPLAHYRTGIVHVHSIYSDGSGSIPEIMSAARAVGADFLVLTDHNTTKARQDGHEKSYDGCDLFVEVETSLPAGHALFFHSLMNSKLDGEPTVQLAWQHFLGQSIHKDAFLVIAHPSNVKTPWTRLDRYSDGIEVINLDSHWRRQALDSWMDLLLTFFWLPFNQYLSELRFLEVYPKDLSTWDMANQVTSGQFGLLAHDAHAKVKITPSYGFVWPSYKDTFRMALNAIWTDQDISSLSFLERKREIYMAIRKGQIAMVMNRLHSFDGNDSYLQCGDSLFRSTQKRVQYSGECKFHVSVPRSFPFPVVVRIIRNGLTEQELRGNPGPFDFDVKGPGVYRAEVWAEVQTLLGLGIDRLVPYVFYNPIFVVP